MSTSCNPLEQNIYEENDKIFSKYYSKRGVLQFLLGMTRFHQFLENNMYLVFIVYRITKYFQIFEEILYYDFNFALSVMRFEMFL